MAGKNTKNYADKYCAKIDELLKSDDVDVFNRYITKKSGPINDELRELFINTVDTYDEKNDISSYVNVKMLLGINLNYFWTILSDEVFFLLPANYSLNLKSIIADLDETLRHNKVEVARARVNRDAENPTDFVREITDIICNKLLTDKALKYIVENL